MSGKTCTNKKTELETVTDTINTAKKEIDGLKAELEKLINSGLSKTKQNNTLNKENIMQNHNQQKPATGSRITFTNVFDVGESVILNKASKTARPSRRDLVPQITVTRSRSRSATETKQNKSPPKQSPKKLRNYNPEEVREYMRKQNEKRLQQAKQLKQSQHVSDDLKKQKLKELQEKSLKLVSRNVEKKRQRSKSREGAVNIAQNDRLNDLASVPHHVPDLISSNLDSKDFNTQQKKSLLKSKSSQLIEKRIHPEFKNITFRKKPINSPETNHNVEQQLINKPPSPNTCYNELQQKAATKIQAAYRRYHQRKMQKKTDEVTKVKETTATTTTETQTDFTSEKPIDVPQLIQNFSIPDPHNFINTVKRKLNLAINSYTPKETVDIGVQFANSICNSFTEKSVHDIKETLYKEINSHSKLRSDFKSVLSDRPLNLETPGVVEIKSASLQKQTENGTKLSPVHLHSKHSQLSKDSDSDTSKNIPNISSESGDNRDCSKTNDKPTNIALISTSVDTENPTDTDLSEYKLEINVDKIKHLKLRRRIIADFNNTVHMMSNKEPQSNRIDGSSKTKSKLPNNIKPQNSEHSIIAYNQTNYDKIISFNSIIPKAQQNVIQTEIKTTLNAQENFNKDNSPKNHIKSTSTSIHSNKSQHSGISNSHKTEIGKERCHDAIKITRNETDAKISRSGVCSENLELLKPPSLTLKIPDDNVSKLTNRNRSKSKSPSNSNSVRTQISNSSSNTPDSNNSIISFNKINCKTSPILIKTNELKSPQEMAQNVLAVGAALLEPHSSTSSVNTTNKSCRNRSSIRHLKMKETSGSSESNQDTIRTEKISSEVANESYSSGFTNIDSADMPSLKPPSLELKLSEHSQPNKVNNTTKKQMDAVIDTAKVNGNQIHLKIEAELHLLNDFNTSLKKYVDLEKSMIENCCKNSDTPNSFFKNRDTQTSLASKTSNVQDLIKNNANGKNDNKRISTVNYSRGTDVAADLSFNSLSSTEFDIEKELPLTSLEASNLNSVTESSIDVSNLEKSVALNESCNNAPYIHLSLGMFEQLIKDEDARIKNLKTILKIREKALLDRSRGELIWLEIQKKHLKETGQLHEVSLLRKKQRGILMRLQHEQNEMQRLKQLQKTASRERKAVLKQQSNMIKSQLSTSSMLTKVKLNAPKETQRSLGPFKVYNIQSHSESIQSETSFSRNSLGEEIISVTSHTQSIISRVSDHEPDDKNTSKKTDKFKRTLLMRELALQKRRKAAEELLQWHQKLLEEEKRVADLEMLAHSILNKTAEADIKQSSLNGTHLNTLWQNMTGRKEKKFNENETYSFSQTSLQQLLKESKKCASKSKFSGSDGSFNKDIEASNNKIICDLTPNKTKCVKSDENVSEQSVIITEDCENVDTESIGGKHSSNNYSSDFEIPTSLNNRDITLKNISVEQTSSISERIDNPTKTYDEKSPSTHVNITERSLSERKSPNSFTMATNKLLHLKETLNADNSKAILDSIETLKSSIQKITSRSDSRFRNSKHVEKSSQNSSKIEKTTEIKTYPELVESKDKNISLSNSISEISSIQKDLNDEKESSVLADIFKDKSQKTTCDVSINTEASQPNSQKSELEISSNDKTITHDNTLKTLEEELNSRNILGENDSIPQTTETENKSLTSDTENINNSSAVIIIDELEDAKSSIAESASLKSDIVSGYNKTDKDINEIIDSKSATARLSDAEKSSQIELVESDKCAIKSKDTTCQNENEPTICEDFVDAKTSAFYDLTLSPSEKEVLEKSSISAEVTDNYSGTSFTKDDVDLAVNSKKEECSTIITDSTAFDEQQETTKSLSYGIIICSENKSITCTDNDRDTSQPVIVIDDEVSEADIELAALDQKTPTKNENTSIPQLDVKKRVSEILADANNSFRSDKSPRLQDLYVTTYDVLLPESSSESESPENGKLSPKQSWTEAEELLKKQLAIEQEIKQLEQQQKQQIPYLFVREIPNKPPPPYTPPVSAPTQTIPSVLPSNVEQIETVSSYAVDILYEAYLNNKLELVSFNEKDASLPSSKLVQSCCVKFLFDLSKELAVDHYSQFKKKAGPSWMQLNRTNKLSLKSPFDRNELHDYLNQQLKQLFGYEKVDHRENAIIRWSRKKRDHVDEILVLESLAEEAEWTNYDEDELLVKNEVTNEIMNMLLSETAQVLSEVLSNRTSLY